MIENFLFLFYLKEMQHTIFSPLFHLQEVESLLKGWLTPRGRHVGAEGRGKRLAVLSPEVQPKAVKIDAEGGAGDATFRLSTLLSPKLCRTQHWLHRDGPAALCRIEEMARFLTDSGDVR